MFTFLLPLVGHTPRVSWERVGELLAGTLRSILAQSDPGFHVLVAGQDRPDISEFADPRVTFLKVDAPYPPDIDSERADKGEKVRLLIREALSRKADAIARMDADDRVSRRLVRYFRENPHPTGYVYSRGYVWDYAAGCLAPSDRVLKAPFHMRCGSCSIIALADARRRLGDDPQALEAYIAGFGKHTEYVERARAQGRPFGQIPFPAAVYVLNHGVGLAYRRGWDSSARERRHARLRRFRVTVTPEMRAEFSLDGAFEPAPDAGPLARFSAALRKIARR